MGLHPFSAVCIALCGCLAACAGVQPSLEHAGLNGEASGRSADREVVRLPGLEYEVLSSGPVSGAHPLRSDDVMIRYVGRLANGSVFSSSANNGAEPSSFSVRTVIPGFSALVQLMRPGDRWRFRIPSYLAYGHQGRRFSPPEPTLKRDIPPDSALTFDVELVSIEPAE